MIRFTCTRCLEPNRCLESEAGRVMACATCGHKLRVPGGDKVESKPRKSTREEEPVDDLEVVEAPTPRRKARDEDAVEDVVEAEPDEDEDDRPKKKKKKVKASEELGPRKSKFEPSKGLLIFGMVIFVAMAVGGLACIVLAGVQREPGFIVAAVFLIPIGILCFLWCMSLMTLKVVLHEGGIVHMRHGKKRIISWFEIKNVWQQITEHYTNGAYTGTSYVYTLQLDDGSRFVYTNNMLGQVEKLGKAILDKTAQAIYPLAMMAYEKGQVVDFGTLGVSKKGLYYGSSLLKWREIDAVKINAGYISVSKRGKWFNWCNIAASSVPNLLIFLAMVNQIVGVQDN
jgi:hypothetical protein